MDTPVRSISTPARGKDGLFIQPKAVGPKREIVERHNRDRFAGHFKYGDHEVNPNTFDEEGDYNCGRCNQADGNKCLLVKIARIDRAAGSCGDWEILCAGDPEMRLNEKSVDAAVYGIAANGKGFGCHRCPYASRAYEPDSRGRDLYCGKGDFRVPGNACCALNGAPTVPETAADRRYAKRG
ncbi:MAG: hypothetical protein V4461_15530 [Pseudomonadota bacterium]